MIDATSAGTAAGLIASGAMSAVVACRRTKVLDVTVTEADGSTSTDLALVDVALIDGQHTGSRAVVRAESIRAVVAAMAAPASTGLSSIAGRLHPLHRYEPGAVVVRLGSQRSPRSCPDHARPLRHAHGHLRRARWRRRSGATRRPWCARLRRRARPRARQRCDGHGDGPLATARCSSRYQTCSCVPRSAVSSTLRRQTMALDVPMPKLGLTMEEATIIEWLVADGAHVDSDQPIMLIETDKTETEVGAPGGGRLHQIGDARPDVRLRRARRADPRRRRIVALRLLLLSPLRRRSHPSSPPLRQHRLRRYRPRADACWRRPTHAGSPPSGA